ncbi:MAG: PTS galactitol transporter subunit IIC [Candidatus Epulonipiscioides saccharophilum]|nr:MAG: PTS galactitol transporter subunit IIC [Epulopiscium sp. AS2M-Bin001]
MKTFEYLITDALGIHVRPAGLLSKEGKKFQSEISIAKDGKSVSTNKLMSIMSLGVKAGNTVTITIDGPDEEVACNAIKEFFEKNL